MIARMIARVLLSIPLGIALASPPAAAQDVLTPQDVARIRGVRSASMSPDGSRVAFTRSVPRTMDEDDGPAWSELWLLDVADGRERSFVSGKVSVRSVDWTPDGASITFLAKREGDEHTALYAIPFDGGEARRVAGLESAITSYSFSPDGGRVALLAAEPEPEEKKKLEKKGFKQKVYEEDLRFGRVWIVEADGGGDAGEEAEPRMLEIEDNVVAVEWSPVDDRLLVVATPRPLVDESYMRKEVRIVDAGSGDVLHVLERPGKKSGFAWSPDGAHVGMIGAADIHDPREGRLLAASSSPAPGADPWVELLPGYEGHVEDFDWENESEILYVASRGVWTVFEVVGIDGGEQRTILGTGGPILRSISVSADGQSAAFVASAPEHPSELFTMSHGDDAALRRTDSNPWLSEKRLARQEAVTFTARDGVELEGVLVRPLDEVEGERYPLIIYVHGGPEAHDSNGWLTAYSRPGHVAAARGYAVFHVNYRGSTGRGVEFSKLSQADFAGKEFDDIVDAGAHFVEAGLVDRDRIGVTGGSYGGFATAWCSTALSEHFAAGVMFVGISNNISKVGTSDIPEEMYLVHHRVRPWEDWDLFLERSPIYHAEKSKTPLLIMHGEEDPRVDNGQSRELYRHLTIRGQAPARLVLYPGEGHGNRRRSARLDFQLRQLRWFDHYLRGEGGDPPHWEVDYGLDDEEEEPPSEG